jgi:hypothetical protein
MNKFLATNVESLNKQKASLIKTIHSLNHKINTLNEKCDTLMIQISNNDKLPTQISNNDKLPTQISNNDKLVDKFIECITNNTFYQELSSFKDITLNNPQGNIMCKYLDVPDLDITSVMIDDIQLNDNNINFCGVIINNCLYLNIPHLINNNYINLLKIGDKHVQIYHNFTPIINSIVVTKINNTNVNIAIYGENLFSFSKVYLSYIDSNYNVFITKLTTNADYTCIRCSYHVDMSVKLSETHKLYIVNYDLTSTTKRFTVNIHPNNMLLD